MLVIICEHQPYPLFLSCALPYPFKRQSHKMVRHTQTIRRQIADELFECVLTILGNWRLKGYIEFLTLIVINISKVFSTKE